MTAVGARPLGRWHMPADRLGRRLVRMGVFVVVADGVERLPGAAEDDGGDRETDQRVGEASAGEDRRDDRIASAPFGFEGSQHERDAKRQRGQRVAESDRPDTA